MDESRLNRKLEEALGYCWHKWRKRKCDGETFYRCIKCGAEAWRATHPDYVANAQLVLREMRKRDDYETFLTFAYDDEIPNTSIQDLIVGGGCLTEMIDLILDETGRLAQLALDWLRAPSKH